MSQETIWKYLIPLAQIAQGELEVQMPRGAQPLTVALQEGIATMWAKVQPDAEQIARAFCVRSTGQPLTGREGRYIGTFQQGDLVSHLFEVAQSQQR